MCWARCCWSEATFSAAARQPNRTAVSAALVPDCVLKPRSLAAVRNHSSAVRVRTHPSSVTKESGFTLGLRHTIRVVFFTIRCEWFKSSVESPLWVLGSPATSAQITRTWVVSARRTTASSQTERAGFLLRVAVSIPLWMRMVMVVNTNAVAAAMAGAAPHTGCPASAKIPTKHPTIGITVQRVGRNGSETVGGNGAVTNRLGRSGTSSSEDPGHTTIVWSMLRTTSRRTHPCPPSESEVALNKIAKSPTLAWTGQSNPARHPMAPRAPVSITVRSVL